MPKWEPRTIVVGVDGSDQSFHAAEVAASLARQRGAKLFLVTVVRPPEGWWGIVGSPPPADALASSMTEAQQSILDVTVANIDLEGVEYLATEEIGEPAAALADVAREQDADLLVVGRRGAGFVERLVMGSVADRVAHYSPCPVLIVP